MTIENERRINGIGMAVLIIGYVLAGASTITGLGYGLYNWGSVGLELGPSVWLGFVLFMKMAGIGLVTALVGGYLTTY